MVSWGFPSRAFLSSHPGAARWVFLLGAFIGSALCPGRLGRPAWGAQLVSQLGSLLGRPVWGAQQVSQLVGLLGRPAWGAQQISWLGSLFGRPAWGAQ